MSIIGPRHGQHRAPMSFTDAELIALGAYRTALRAMRVAATEERRVVNENFTRVGLDQAWTRTSAAREALSAALDSLNATLHEE